MRKNLTKMICLLMAVILFHLLAKTRDVARYDVAPHVEGVMFNGNRIATAFYMKYNNKVYLVTNKHVCVASKELLKEDVLITKNNRYKILAISDIHDLCLASTSREDGLSMAYKDVVDLDKVTLTGHPDGDALIIRSGRIVESNSMQFDWIGSFPVDVKVTSVYGLPGSSGSPLTNEYGRVVGVLFSGAHTKSISLVVPLADLKFFMDVHAK